MQHAHINIDSMLGKGTARSIRAVPQSIALKNGSFYNGIGRPRKYNNKDIDTLVFVQTSNGLWDMFRCIVLSLKECFPAGHDSCLLHENFHFILLEALSIFAHFSWETRRQLCLFLLSNLWLTEAPSPAKYPVLWPAPGASRQPWHQPFRLYIQSSIEPLFHLHSSKSIITIIHNLKVHNS